MEKIYIKSKMNAEDFRNFLYYNQYYAEKHYLLIMLSVSIIIGLISSYFSSDKFITFLIISIVCIFVFIGFPWLKIKFNYKKIYRRNRSAAFSQSQMYVFDENFIGFKNEYEEEYYYNEYKNISKVIETKTLFIISYSKKQHAIIAKNMVSEEKVKKIRNLFLTNIENKYNEITRF